MESLISGTRQKRPSFCVIITYFLFIYLNEQFFIGVGLASCMAKKYNSYSSEQTAFRKESQTIWVSSALFCTLSTTLLNWKFFFFVHCPSPWQKLFSSTKHFQICMPFQLTFFSSPSVTFALIRGPDKMSIPFPHALALTGTTFFAFFQFQFSSWCLMNTTNHSFGLHLLTCISPLVPNSDYTTISRL